MATSDGPGAKANLLAELWRLDESARVFELAIHQVHALERQQERYVPGELARWLLSAAKLKVEIGQTKDAIRLLEQESAKVCPSPEVLGGAPPQCAPPPFKRL